MTLSVDLKNIASFVSEEELNSMMKEVTAANETLRGGTGEGNDFIGWLDLPSNIDPDELSRVKKAAKKIISDSQVLIVVGIGGSYLGARAVIEFIKSPNYNLKKKNTPDIFFVGNNLSGEYINEIIVLLGDRDFSVNVISKSGTTTEPAIAFRIFKGLLENKYGEKEAAKRIFTTTDKKKGALKKLADAKGYESFVIPDNVGGRYSVLTPVGLLPIACAGIDIDRLILGANNAMEELKPVSLNNPVCAYVAARNALYRKNKYIEILACYEPSFRFMAEWWKQLYGESEGKDGKGIFPASVELTADLHSMGQYIQDGERILFETIVNILNPNSVLRVPNDPANIDGLNFLSEAELDYINKQASRGTVLAHVDGGVPNIIINIDKADEYNLGYLIYFFELACGLSGYTLGVNPFNQPGVEAYKKNMFALLGKPGYENEKAKLEERLKQ
ncbi:MAG: glucose-6-phosphate isomerase [Clostridiales bacterium]|nr:glucose-6-phosphate isomerase [Clostridiales bacterium]